MSNFIYLIQSDIETAELVGQVFADGIKLWGYEYA
jgi:hypothetical protein